MSDQLFLIEFLIEELCVGCYTFKDVEATIVAGSLTTLHVKAGDVPEKRASLGCDNSSNEQSSPGTSYLFPSTPNALLNVMQSSEIKVNIIYKETGKTIGKTEFPWPSALIDMTKNFRQGGKPASVQDSYDLFSEKKERTGEIKMLIRLSSFGKNIETHFQVVKSPKTDSKSYLFKTGKDNGAFTMHRYGKSGSADMFPIAPFFGKDSMLSRVSALSQEIDLTLSEISKKLCKNIHCPAAPFFKDLGIGPLAGLTCGGPTCPYSMKPADAGEKTNKSCGGPTCPFNDGDEEEVIQETKPCDDNTCDNKEEDVGCSDSTCKFKKKPCDDCPFIEKKEKKPSSDDPCGGCPFKDTDQIDHCDGCPFADSAHQTCPFVKPPPRKPGCPFAESVTSIVKLNHKNTGTQSPETLYRLRGPCGESSCPHAQLVDLNMPRPPIKCCGKPNCRYVIQQRFACKAKGCRAGDGKKICGPYGCIHDLPSEFKTICADCGGYSKTGTTCRDISKVCYDNSPKIPTTCFESPPNGNNDKPYPSCCDAPPNESCCGGGGGAPLPTSCYDAPASQETDSFCCGQPASSTAGTVYRELPLPPTNCCELPKKTQTKKTTDSKKKTCTDSTCAFKANTNSSGDKKDSLAYVITNDDACCGEDGKRISKNAGSPNTKGKTKGNSVSEIKISQEEFKLLLEGLDEVIMSTIENNFSSWKPTVNENVKHDVIANNNFYEFITESAQNSLIALHDLCVELWNNRSRGSFFDEIVIETVTIECELVNASTEEVVQDILQYLVNGLHLTEQESIQLFMKAIYGIVAKSVNASLSKLPRLSASPRASASVSAPEVSTSKRPAPATKAVSEGGKRKTRPKGRKKKARSKLTAGEFYPGVKVGHKYCTLSGKPVPPRMGWLWNTMEACGLSYGCKPRRGWKPGAIAYSTWKVMRGIGEPKEEPRTLPIIKRDDRAKMGQKAALQIRKKDGMYWITMKPMKDPKTCGEDEMNPFIDCEPMRFRVTKDLRKVERVDENTEVSPDDCECQSVGSSSQESDIAIEFTPPAGVVNKVPTPYKKKPVICEIDTQYDPKDIVDEDKKGKKGKKGKKK